MRRGNGGETEQIMAEKRKAGTRKSVAGKAAGRKTTRRTAALKKAAGADPMPERVYAQASPRSIGGRAMFDTLTPITAAHAVDFTSEEALVRTAASRLSNAGFDVLQISATTINIAAPAALYNDVFETTLFTDERPVIKEGAREDTATFIDARDTDLPGLINPSRSPLRDVLEGVAIEEPRYFMEGPMAPQRSYWHLRVPGDVSLGVNADRAHRSGTTGRRVKVAMTDTGWYRHAYFVQRGYRAQPVVLGPGTANPLEDENGHGTAESANAFAVAPDIDFTMVKLGFTNTIGAFNAAVALSPDIITNSWGSSIRTPPLSAADQALAAAIALAVAEGIVVVFSAGNGHFGFPGQHPDVISAGGVFLHEDGSLEASSYASGFASEIYPGRNTPDVSGLVGMVPRAAYIMLPLQAGCLIDEDLAGGTHPDGDETAGDDGWAAISGTSAAAPQIAGVCALVKQAGRRLQPEEIRKILAETARDVTVGTNANGNTAGPGYDVATGHGLVDAHRAVLLAKVRSLRRPASVTPETSHLAATAATTEDGAGLSSEDVDALETMILAHGAEVDL